MSMIIVTLHLKVAPEKRIQILKTIHSMIGPTSAQPGCLQCNFWGSTQNDDILILLEKWESQETLNQHIKSEEFLKVLAAMDTACEQPQISFYGIDSCAGMELVEKVLGGKL
jgi:quinol monooxygenase YgiN